MEKTYQIIEADGIMWIAEKREKYWWFYNPLNDNWETFWKPNQEVKVLGEFVRNES